MAREHVHLIGVGGTGMSALAGLLQQSGCRVTGSDRVLYPPTSTLLEALDVEVHAGFDPARLKPAPDLVVVGNAVSRGNPEVEAILDRKLRYESMPRVICERFLRGRHSIVVAGTHGKTTTTSMLAWLLAQAGRDPSFLIGGLPLNFDQPFHLGQGAAFVIEGDEYDTAFFDKGPKFAHYRPDTAILGGIEFDHADIYRDLTEVKRTFGRLISLIPGTGLLIRNDDCDVTRGVTSAALSRVEGFGLADGRWRAVDLKHDGAGSRFRLLRDEELFAEIELALGGEHNVMNATAAAAAACEQGLTAREIATGLASFAGVRRRLELRGEVEGILVFDDFAHHPTAIEATLQAVRGRFRDRRLWAVLEPRSWSLRRSVFQERLAESFDSADEVVIADVYRGQDVPEDSKLDTARLADEVTRRGRTGHNLPDAESIVGLLAQSAGPGDVVVVMSNGGFDGLHERLLEALRARFDAGQREPV